MSREGYYRCHLIINNTLYCLNQIIVVLFIAEKVTRIEIEQDVDAKEIDEILETLERDCLLEEPTKADAEKLIEAKSTIVAESGVISAEIDTDNHISQTKLPEKCEKIVTNLFSSAFGSVTTIKSAGRKQSINARTVLWYFSFFGFAINYMLRVNINIAITEMVTLSASKANTVEMSECVVDQLENSNTLLVHSNLSSLMIEHVMPRAIPSYSLEQQILDFFGVRFVCKK